MRKLGLFIFFTFSILLAAQTRDAEFPGGKSAFQKEFMRMVHSYVDVHVYSVDGKFTFIIEIDAAGRMTGLKVYPRVRNYEEFRQDMEFAMKKIKKKWKPALKDGVPVKSTFLFEINFTTDYADHGE